ncbi:MAG: metal ABC transporter solute-binding protein, Zn/Mn family, partial [Methyloligellaceae bacterium]
MRISLIISLFLFAISTQARADVNVVTSIKPVHSLVSAVMKGTKAPYLIVKASHSPHSYNMKPSDARALRKADLIFWVGDELETFLQKPIKSLGKNSKKVELIKTHGLDLLDFRRGKDWQHHEKKKHDHEHSHGSNRDIHIWLNPKNAERIVEQVVRYLVEKDPKNA